MIGGILFTYSENNNRDDDDDDDDDDHVTATAGCDWLIVVDDCVGVCQLVSPEYPDFYPANIRCSYLITSFHDSRVELVMSSDLDEQSDPVFLDIKSR